MKLNTPSVSVHLGSPTHSDLSFVTLQHQRYGSVTNSMILAVGFRAIIVAEYFLYEDL